MTPVENEELREVHAKEFVSPERARHVRVAVTGKPIHQDPKFTSNDARVR
ncbi:MAG: hypothetical protein Q7S40_26930 [Opitutaceae bacterium]|nr:hypothetical protein [Opitutaceae bacterium]